MDTQHKAHRTIKAALQYQGVDPKVALSDGDVDVTFTGGAKLTIAPSPDLDTPRHSAINTDTARARFQVRDGLAIMAANWEAYIRQMLKWAIVWHAETWTPMKVDALGRSVDETPSGSKTVDTLVGRAEGAFIEEVGGKWRILDRHQPTLTDAGRQACRERANALRQRRDAHELRKEGVDAG